MVYFLLQLTIKLYKNLRGGDFRPRISKLYLSYHRLLEKKYLETTEMLELIPYHIKMSMLVKYSAKDSLISAILRIMNANRSKPHVLNNIKETIVNSLFNGASSGNFNIYL